MTDDDTKARTYSTGITGLTVTVGGDGVWLNFRNSTKDWANLNLNCLADRQPSAQKTLTDRIILQWCKELQEATRLDDDNDWQWDIAKNG